MWRAIGLIAPGGATVKSQRLVELTFIMSSAGRTSISPRRKNAKQFLAPASMKVTDGIAMRIIDSGSAPPDGRGPRYRPNRRRAPEPARPSEAPRRMPRSSVKRRRKRARLSVIGRRFFTTPTVRATRENSTSCSTQNGGAGGVEHGVDVEPDTVERRSARRYRELAGDPGKDQTGARIKEQPPRAHHE